MYLKTFFMLSTAITDTDLKKELAPAVKQASKDRAIAKKKQNKQIITHTITHKENYHSRKLPILGR